MVNVLKIMFLLMVFNQAIFAQIEITFRWDRPRGEVTPRLLGFNIWDGYDADVATNPQYQENIDYMSPGLIRFHSSESTRDSGEHERGWVDESNRTWDADKIAEVLGAFNNMHDVQMNISNWPSWISSGTLPASKFDEYAQWCADLVKIVNIDLGFNIQFWAAFNEAENKVEGNAAGLAELHNKCAIAMKAVDPTIKVGGGEWTQPWDDSGLNTFIAAAKDHLDFFTYHHYVTGDSNKPDDEIFAAAKGMADRVGGIQSKLESNGIGDIPIWITENNVYWSWDLDKRQFMRSIKGALFNSLLLKYYAEGGKLDGSAIWNDSDNTYGVMGGDFSKRPTTHLIMLKNRYLLGTTVSVSSRRSAIVNAMAVTATTGKTLMLMNQSTVDTTVNLVFSGWTPDGSTCEQHTITQSGYTNETISFNANVMGEFPIAARSIVVLRFDSNTKTIEKKDNIPSSHNMLQAYPNPFNPQTKIRFYLDKAEDVSVDVFDLNGRHVLSLISGFRPQGEHSVAWQATSLPNGIYLLRLQTESSTRFVKITFIK